MSNLGNTLGGDDQPADVTMQQGSMPNVGQDATQAPTLAPQSTLAGVVGPTQQQQAEHVAGSSRLLNIIKAVANVGSNALAGIPSQGRPSFINGLGQGVRSAQAAQAQQQEIKFKDQDSQLRIANLHNADLELQNRTQTQQDAHQVMQEHQDDYNEAHGIVNNPHPNVGDAVTQTLKAQTAANGAAEIVPGTSLSADGKTINVPDGSSETQAGMLGKYKELAGKIPGIVSFPGMDKAQFVPSANVDQMTHALAGFNPDGSPMSHDQLKNLIPALQSQRDALAKGSNTTPYQLGTLDSLIGIYKANEKNHSDAEDVATAKAAQHAGAKKQAEKQGELAAENTPEAIKGAADKAAAIAKATYQYKADLQDNAASDKGDKSGNWVQGATANQKTKAGLAENIAENAMAAAAIIKKRPDLFGSGAGRITSLEQMTGNNDPDIAKMGQIIHNIALANNGVHGSKAHEEVTETTNTLLNGFKNGPRAMAGALKGLTDSVQTFVDDARPETYATHSKKLGVLNGMVKR
jgi:hypothetical protein